MVDSLSQLEERVEVLIHHLERTLRVNEELHQRNAKLESEAERLQDDPAAWQFVRGAPTEHHLLGVALRWGDPAPRPCSVQWFRGRQE